MQGKFITFEGIDGGGKSTQLHLAAQYLREQGFEVVESREPGGTAVGEKLRDIVLDPQQSLSDAAQTLIYLAARYEHIEKVLRPALKAGKIVLCDRFSDSTLVYQGFAAGKNREEIEKLKLLVSLAVDNFIPDKTLLFDGDPKKFALRRQLRGINDRYEQQGLEYQKVLRAGFLTLAQADPARICIIDAEQDMMAVKKSVQRIIDTFLEEDE